MSHSNILRGPKYSSPTFEEELEETFLDELLVTANKRRPNEHVYLIDVSTNETLTSKKFIDQSYKVAAELQALGCDRNDGLVGILSENRLEYPIVILGTLLTGAAVICYSLKFTIEELRKELKIATPTALFCSPKYYNNLIQIAHPSTRIIILDSNELLNVSPCQKFSQLSQSTRAYQHEVGPRLTDDLAFVLYTSGTTDSRPKGVMLTHENMVYILKLLTEENLVKSSRWMSMIIAPMSHAYGLISLLLAVPESRPLAIMPRFDKRLFLSTIEEYKIAQLGLIPTIINLSRNSKVDQYDLSRLESLSYGDDPLGFVIEETLEKKLNGLKYAQQGYGMTECTLITTIKNVKSKKPKSCGSVIPGAQLKIVDLITRETLGKNEVGEICIKGPHVMKRYFGNPKATSETLDEEGWLHSGDVGYYDEDEELFIVDRAKELIQFMSFRLSPTELEALLLTHPKIDDCGVIGVPDDFFGHVPKAYVVKVCGAEVTEQEIIEFVKKRLPPSNRLSGGVEFVSRIPRSPTGKILRDELRKFGISKHIHPSLRKNIWLDFA